jgi:uncharacterized protein
MSLTSSGLPAVQDDEKTMAMLAHLCIFIPMASGLGPLIIYFMKKDTSPFIAYHALQAAIFQFGFIAFAVISYILGMVFVSIISMLTFGLGSICGLVLCLIPLPVFAAIPFALKAKNGDWAGYPAIGGVGMPAGVS